MDDYTKGYRDFDESLDYKYTKEELESVSDYRYGSEADNLTDYRYDLDKDYQRELEKKLKKKSNTDLKTEPESDYKEGYTTVLQSELKTEEKATTPGYKREVKIELKKEPAKEQPFRRVPPPVRPPAVKGHVMRVCMVAEGCYPYVVGGVSNWIHSLIQSLPNVEFILLTIIAGRGMRGKFVYEFPINITEVYEVYLQDVDWVRRKRNKDSRSRLKLSEKEYQALRSLILNQNINWHVLFEMFRKRKISLNELLMGEDFYRAVRDCYDLQYSQSVFSDFLWTMRSIYLPLFLVLKTDVPDADLYHCVATGYAGVLGCMAKDRYGSRILISEHGIYTREREEELIKAKWVTGIYKNIWIEQFRKMSKVAYEEADLVTSLYEHARELQIELGCPAEKTMVTPNGINTKRLENLPQKTEEDKGFVNIGAVLRVTPIKDVKTMIQAFAFAKERQPKLKLWIMGPTDEDKAYAQECFDMVEAMQVKDVVFTGRIDVKDYLGRMDVTILTSVSEGQPLTILESYAAHRPVIATDVGNCYGLIYGEGDDFGQAGILTHIMNIEEISQAMVELAVDATKRVQMGENGYKRLMSKYRIEHMKATYEKIYKDFASNAGVEWTQENFEIHMGDVSPADHTEKRDR